MDNQAEQVITDSYVLIHGENQPLPQSGLSKIVVYNKPEKCNLSPPVAAELRQLGRVVT